MPGSVTTPATAMVLSSGVVAVLSARRSTAAKACEARRAQRDARLDRCALALGALGQRLQRQADAGQRVAEHHAEDRQHVARRIPGRGPITTATA